MDLFRIRRRSAAVLAALGLTVAVLVAPSAALAQESPQPSAPATTETPSPSQTAAPVDTPAPVETPAPDETPAPADGTTPRETPAPTEAPAPAETPAKPRAAQTITRQAVLTQTTGFGMQYVFGPSVQPSDPRLRVDGADGPGRVEEAFDWTDKGGRHLQWNYAMPQDGAHTIVFTADLVDTGKLSEFSVRYTSRVDRTAGSIAVRTTCDLLHRGAVIEADRTPFACDPGSGQGSSGMVLAISGVVLNAGAEIVATIDVRNMDETAPKLSLANGYIGTANQQHRLIMGDGSWFPFVGGAPDPHSAYASIANGTILTWTATMLGAPFAQSEASSHAQGYFVYEILLGGKQTGYWLRGQASYCKYLQLYYPNAECAIYAGDPNHVGTPVVGETPFTCHPTAMSSGNVKRSDDTTFEVGMASVTTLTDAGAAQDNGVNEACKNDAGRPCVVTVGPVTRQPAERNVATARTGSASHVNNSGSPQPISFDFTFSREITNNFDQMFGVTTGMSVKGEFMGAKAEASIEITNETTFGYEVGNGFEVTEKSEAEVPSCATGYFLYEDVFDTFTSDLYFVGEGDTWYRVTGAEIQAPVPPVNLAAATNGPLVEPAQAGQPIAALVYQCDWLPDRADAIVGKVIADYDKEHQILPSDRTISHYAEELLACGAPGKWHGLTVHDFKGEEGALKYEVLQAFLAAEEE